MTKSLAVLLVVLMCDGGPARSQTVQISVRAQLSHYPINPFLYGINTARWDESLFPERAENMLLSCDRVAIAKIQASGVTLLKYPGGNDADAYVWNAPDNNPAEMDTDEYLALCRAVGAEPFITINFNAAPQLAADWVRYCNRERGYNVKYWEVGDEQWGTWAKGHAPPEVYAKKFMTFVRAMKAVDPTIKVATNVPLGPHPEQWTTRVLKAAGKHVDLITFTFYPQQWGKEDDDSLFASVDVYRRQFIDLRREVVQALGVQRGGSIWLVNVGYNSVNHSPGPQTLQMVNALWTAEMLGTMAETGTDVACYWAVHNAFPPRKGDYGYLSSEGANTPSYTYRVFPMLAPRFRGTAIMTGSEDPRVRVYASKNGKALTLMLVNRYRTQSVTVSVRYEGFVPKSKGLWALLDPNTSPAKGSTATEITDPFSFRLPSSSLSVVELVASDSIAPPANLALGASASASSFSVIGPQFGPASAADGKSYTRWCSAAWTKSNGEETQWLQLAWTVPQEVRRVRIHWGETWGIHYRLEVSRDAVTWDIVREVTEGKGGIEEFTWAPVNCRYIRLSGMRGTKGISAYAVQEMEVY
jgi:hypothetical protein